jgi:Zn-dependent oligopeptidase
MFEAVFKKDPLDPAAGRKYRNIILANGGARDAADFLLEFLGREPSNAAFLRQKGLAAYITSNHFTE